MGPEADRVVQLFVGERDQRFVGSGYLLTDGLVLTATHVVRHGAPCRVVIGLPPAEELAVTIDAPRATCDAAADVALLHIGTVGRGDPPAPLGKLTMRGSPVDARAVGFPRWKARPASADHAAFRDSHTAGGRIDPLSNRRGDTLEFLVDAEPEPDPEHSPWEAMSGAAVWAGGRIIGVVAEHHAAEGTGMLACRPLSAVRDKTLVDALGIARGLIEVGIPDPFDEAIEVHRAGVLRRCPELKGRDAELAQLADFCAGDETMLWIQGPPWAGKTALVAVFAAAPPPGVTVVPLFVSERTSDDGFLREGLRVIGALLRRATDGPVTLDEMQTMLDRLLAEAGRARSPTVLLVDGLDEDPKPPAIAELLPRIPPEGTKLIVTSRPGAAEALAGHPVADRPPFILAPSEAAGARAREAKDEINKLLRGPRDGARDILGLLAVVDGFTADDLGELVEPTLAPGEVEQLLAERLARSLTALDEPDGRRYVFAHAELRAAARAFFGSRLLSGVASRIDAWVDRYAADGWPEETPDFCLGRYLDLLRSREEHGRLAVLAADRGRRARQEARTGGDRLLATSQVVAALDALRGAAKPEVATATRLAITAFPLRHHDVQTTEPEMLTFLVRTGRARAAIDAMLTVSRDDDRWGTRLGRLAAALYETGADRDAAELLSTIGPEDMWVRQSVAGLIAAPRPDVALAIHGEAAGQPDDGLLAGLAAHDAYVGAALELAGDDLARRLVIAQSLVARDPNGALELVSSGDWFQQRSAGTKWTRETSFARVEVARMIADDDLALPVLLSELDGSDAAAALLAALPRLDPADLPWAAARFLAFDAAPWDALRLLASVATGTPAPPAERVWWRSRDFDLVARFGADLARRASTFEAVLRTVLNERSEISDIDNPHEAASTILTELACLDAVRAGDEAALAARLELGGLSNAEAYAAAARRVASADPERAAALAHSAGAMATWVLRDVVGIVAPVDRSAAMAIVDSIEPKYTGTRLVLLGAIGAVVDPHDETAIAELTRRLPGADEGEAAASLVADAAVRLAGLLAADEPRAAELITRFRPLASGPALDRYEADRAARLAIEDPDAAVRALTALNPTHRDAARAVTEAALAVAAAAPPSAAVRALEHAARVRFRPPAREAVFVALAGLDAYAALAAAEDVRLPPETLARALAAALGASEDRPGLMTDLRDAMGGLRALDHEGYGVLLEWAVSSATGDWLPEAVEDGELCDNLLALTIAKRTASQWPAALVAAATRRTADHDVDDPKDRVARLVDVMARADPISALAAIDAVDWQALDTAGVPSVIIGTARERAVGHLAGRKWNAAFERALGIEDRYCRRDALAAVAAQIPGWWVPRERARALRRVLDEAATELTGIFDITGPLIAELRSCGNVDGAMHVELLADSTRWPTDKGIWWLGEAVALIAPDPAAVSAAVDGLYMALGDLGA